MPTRKKPSPSPKRKITRPARKAATSGGGVSAMATAQLKQMRKTVDQLRARLEREANARMAASSVVAEAKKARDALAAQMKSLRDEGGRLAKELKTAMGRSNKLEAARQQAVDKIAELRAELAHRTEELKRKSEELGRLAMDSAGRARDIIMSEGERPSSAAKAEEAPTVESDTVETESVTADTLKREESPRESSIEEEIHPERKD
jgi:chromosome segregation ATPase